MHSLDARLLKGFGNLCFGSLPNDAEKIFGHPEETGELKAEDGSLSLVWHYWSKGFSLFFDRSANDCFCCVEIDRSVQLTMWSIPVFGLCETELKKLFVNNGFRELDEEEHEWGEKRITFDDAMADFYFEKGVLVSVNYSRKVSGDQLPLTSN